MKTENGSPMNDGEMMDFKSSTSERGRNTERRIRNGGRLMDISFLNDYTIEIQKCIFDTKIFKFG